MPTDWNITIKPPFDGLVANFYDNDYPAVGNWNQAGKLVNIDLTNPDYFTQGLGRASMGTVSTLIKGIMPNAASNNYGFAIGGEKVYALSATSIGSLTGFPHTITGQAGIMGEDVLQYRGGLFYSYNYSGGGNLGRYDITAGTFNDIFGSTYSPGGTVLQSGVPHKLFTWNDKLYITNGHYITTYDEVRAEFTEKTLDIPPEYIIVDICSYSNRLFILATSSVTYDSAKSALFIWDGGFTSTGTSVSTTWDDEIDIVGRASAVYNYNGTVIVFHTEPTGKRIASTCNGSTMSPVFTFTGDLPKYYQVCTYKNLLCFSANDSHGEIYTFGQVVDSGNNILTQLTDYAHTDTLGGLSAPFGKLLSASEDITDGVTTFNFSYYTGITSTAVFQSVLADNMGSGEDNKLFIDEIIVNFYKLESGCAADFEIWQEGDTSYLWTQSISYADDGAIRQRKFQPNTRCVNFSLLVKFTDATTATRIKGIFIKGHSTKD